MNKISSPLKDVCLFQKNKYIFIYRIFISRWKMSITTRYTNRNVFYDKISQDKTEKDKFTPRLKGGVKHAQRVGPLCICNTKMVSPSISIIVSLTSGICVHMWADCLKGQPPLKDRILTYAQKMIKRFAKFVYEIFMCHFLLYDVI